MWIKEDLGLLEIQRLITSDPIPGIQKARDEDYSVVCTQTRIFQISIGGVRQKDFQEAGALHESSEAQSSFFTPLKTHWPLLSGEGWNNPGPEAKQVLL